VPGNSEAAPPRPLPRLPGQACSRLLVLR
jgi:hypothetical protein